MAIQGRGEGPNYFTFNVGKIVLKEKLFFIKNFQRKNFFEGESGPPLTPTGYAQGRQPIPKVFEPKYKLF